MVKTCSNCCTPYDDAERSTICPHDLIMPAADLRQKILALDMMDMARHGKLMFKPGCGPIAVQPMTKVEIQSISYNGVITLRGMEGEFTPDMLEVR